MSISEKLSRCGSKVKALIRMGLVVLAIPVLALVSGCATNYEVPEVVGLTLMEAEHKLSEVKGAQLTVNVEEQYDNTVPEGVVISQAPQADTSVDINTEVLLVVSRGRLVGILEPGEQVDINLRVEVQEGSHVLTFDAEALADYLGLGGAPQPGYFYHPGNAVVQMVFSDTPFEDGSVTGEVFLGALRGPPMELLLTEPGFYAYRILLTDEEVSTEWVTVIID